MKDYISDEVKALHPKPIDHTKCIKRKSLYEQIKTNAAKSLKEQKKQFNLGNGLRFSDPIEASKYLLEREYGETFLFKENNNQAVFIPPVFTSPQTADSASLDYDVEGSLKRTLENLVREQPEHWLREELDTFIQLYGESEEFKQDKFDSWKLNMKLLYLMTVELKTRNLSLPSTTVDNAPFIQVCIA